MRLFVFAFILALLITKSAVGQGGPQPCSICFELDITTCFEEFGPLQDDGVFPTVCNGDCEITYMQPEGICKQLVTYDALGKGFGDETAPELTPNDWVLIHISSSVPIESGEGFSRRDDAADFVCATRVTCSGCEWDPLRLDFFCWRSQRILSIKEHLTCTDVNENPILCTAGPIP